MVTGSQSLISCSPEVLAANLEGIMKAYNCSREVAAQAVLLQ